MTEPERRESSSVSAWLLRSIAVALACATTGELARLLAPPLGFGAIAWPPAGIGLACALRYGPGVLPGVGLGALAVHLSPFGGEGLAVLRTPGAAGIAGVGAILQAGSGAFVARRLLGGALGLHGARHQVRFLLVAIPLGSLVGATWGVGWLVAGGRVPPEALSFAWMTWWVSSTIGATLFAPTTLTFIGEPYRAWARRRLTVALPLIAAFGLVTLLFIRVASSGRERAGAEFSQRAAAVANAIEGMLREQVAAIETIVSLYDASERVDRGGFRRFTERLLARNQGLVSLAFLPRVAGAHRAAFESEVRAAGFPGFSIQRQVGQGLAPVRAQEVHFPIFFVEPLPANALALGFDLASDEERLRVMKLASVSGTATATRPVALVLGGLGARGAAVVAPIYGPAPAPNRHQFENVIGFAVGVLRVDLVVKQVFRGFERGDLRARVTDAALAGADALLYEDPRELDLAPGATWEKPLHVASRSYRLELSSSPRSVGRQKDAEAWLILVSALAAVMLLAFTLMSVAGREAFLQERVNAQTTSLRGLLAEKDALVNDLTRAQRELEALSRTDALTGVWNRRALDERLEQVMAEGQRGHPFALLLCDIDHFKRVNDVHGHTVGDEVLVAVAGP